MNPTMGGPQRPQQKPWTPPPLQAPQAQYPAQPQVVQQPLYHPSGQQQQPMQRQQGGSMYPQAQQYSAPMQQQQQSRLGPQFQQQQPPQQHMQQSYNPSMGNNMGQNGYPQQQQQLPGQPYSNLQTQFQDFQSSAAGQLGLQLGTQAFAQVQQNVNQNFDKYVGGVNKVRYYFNVSNSYVLNKIRLVLFPFRHVSWSRSTKMEAQNEYRPPREDLNAPDLYIPVMSLVTYVLVIGISLGIEAKKLAEGGAKNGSKGRFTPDVLGVTASSAIFVLLFEVLFIKLGMYLLNVNSSMTLLDSLAYCGYKFVPLIGTLVLKLGVGKRFVYSFFLYSMIAYGFFTLRTLRYCILPDANSGNEIVGKPARKRRVVFLFAIAALQIITTWILL